jgi:hypothetical protein
MKFSPLYAVLIGAGLMAAPAHLSGQPAPPAATNSLGPRITFDSNEYNFGRIGAGELVKHVFIVSNAGDQTLVISSVTPGCHCTTAGDWTHTIEPGQTGTIPIQFDSSTFHGNVTKPIRVASNDKLAPVRTITLQGTIWKAIEISPPRAFINVMPDALSNAATIVHITNHSEQPLELSNPTTASGPFKAELKTIQPGKEFELTVTAVPPLATGSVAGRISIQTSLTNRPVLDIPAVVILQPELSLTPVQQIVLRPLIKQWTTNFITITANVSKALVLSDPEVSDQRVSVELKEIVPGRIFRLAAAFPPGYQLGPGQKAQLSVKSNNAQHPVIIVPILQIQGRRAPHP